MTTPDLQLRTLYVLDGEGRIVATREPGSRRPPAFVLIRGTATVACASRRGLPAETATELARLGRDEPCPADLQRPPVHAHRYVELIGGTVEAGPAFSFPGALGPPADVVVLRDRHALHRAFADLADELAARAPVLAVLDGEDAVSVCFCARRSDEAAEAGLQTLETHRGRGHGARVTAAWAAAVRETGRVPLYSTAWTNDASRAVARKLGLIPYASDWNILDG